MATQKRGRYVGSGLTHSMTKERKDRAKRFLNQRDFERSNIAVLLLFILSSCIKTVALFNIYSFVFKGKFNFSTLWKYFPSTLYVNKLAVMHFPIVSSHGPNSAKLSPTHYQVEEAYILVVVSSLFLFLLFTFPHKCANQNKHESF